MSRNTTGQATNAINQLTGGKLGEVVNAVGEKMEVVKGKFSEAFGNVKNTVMTIFGKTLKMVLLKVVAAVNKVKEISAVLPTRYRTFGVRLKELSKRLRLYKKVR